VGWWGESGGRLLRSDLIQPLVFYSCAQPALHRPTHRQRRCPHPHSVLQHVVDTRRQVVGRQPAVDEAGAGEGGGGEDAVWRQGREDGLRHVARGLGRALLALELPEQLHGVVALVVAVGRVVAGRHQGRGVLGVGKGGKRRTDGGAEQRLEVGAHAVAAGGRHGGRCVLWFDERGLCSVGGCWGSDPGAVAAEGSESAGRLAARYSASKLDRSTTDPCEHNSAQSTRKWGRTSGELAAADHFVFKRWKNERDKAACQVNGGKNEVNHNRGTLGH
jgi:hypothetical protein